MAASAVAGLLALGVLLPNCSSSDSGSGTPDTGSVTDTGTDTGSKVDTKTDTFVPSTCPDNTATGWEVAAPTKTKKSVCTRPQIDEASTACWGGSATAATCNAYKGKVSAACFDCSAVGAANVLNFADSAACAQMVDSASDCGKKLQTLTNCQALACGSPSPGDCADQTAYGNCVGTTSVKTGAACRAVSQAAAPCRADSKFANCFATDVTTLQEMLYIMCGTSTPPDAGPG